MGKPVIGEVVVLPFPQTNLQAGKRRPALVVVDLAGDNLILCQITSQARTMRVPQAETCLRASCCQSRTTGQLPTRMRRKLRWSRNRSARSLSHQRGESLCFPAGSRQLCQKSPSTNTATFSVRNTMFLRPGSVRT